MSNKDRQELERLWAQGTMYLDVLTRALAGASISHAAGPDSVRAMTNYAAEKLQWMQEKAERFKH